jgi:hypothetical protein
MVGEELERDSCQNEAELRLDVGDAENLLVPFSGDNDVMDITHTYIVEVMS